MSEYTFVKVNNAIISLGNGETLTVKKLSVMIDGKIVIDEKEVSVRIENGTLIIDQE